TISAPYKTYACPEGADVTMQCVVEGHLTHPQDHLQKAWLYNQHSKQHCRLIHPRQLPSHNHTHAYNPSALGLHYRMNAGTLYMTLSNLTAADSGRYCCLVLEVEGKIRQHHVVEERVHDYILLTVSPRVNSSQQCTKERAEPRQPESSTAAGLATAGCIMGILSLPLILLLVYKQRQTATSNRRAHELVRMDSEAQGHENPVFLGESPKMRTVSQIMRQQSETGRHLLSEPGTPLSPPTHGDVFFPSQGELRPTPPHV
ncbi:VISTA protein, partial [Amia calva]|nr:VISTA protein [Amia calva]